MHDLLGKDKGNMDLYRYRLTIPWVRHSQGPPFPRSAIPRFPHLKV